MAPLHFFHTRNAVTYAGVGAALVASALAGDPAHRGIVGQCLALTTLTDLFDGRFARLFRSGDHDRRFGVQLDSLADAVLFGFAPVICLWRYNQHLTGALGGAWLACSLVYVLCALTRLGYYNIMVDEHPGFVGVPSTLFGVFWSAWLLFDAPPLMTMAAMLLSGLLMVVPIQIRRPGLKVLLVIAAISVALLFAHGLQGAGSYG
jgi:CDP-diacylglycerol---serine O-phosphatidyltransferase